MTLTSAHFVRRLPYDQQTDVHESHKGVTYPGECAPIIDRSLWDKVHSILQTSPWLHAAHALARTPALLKGLIFTQTGCAMTPALSKKGSQLFSPCDQ
jgi:site-specific DNA recombinase